MARSDELLQTLEGQERRHPESVFYDLVCYWAKVGDRQRVLDAVRKSVERGYGNLGEASGLELLHGDPAWCCGPRGGEGREAA